MAENKSEKEISEGELYNQRESQFVVRGLQLLNGGGAIALMAFLSQTWDSSFKNIHDIRSIILTSVLIMIVGIVLTTWSSILRLRDLDWTWKKKDKSGWTKIIYRHQFWITLRAISFVCFIISTLYFTIRLFPLI